MTSGFFNKILQHILSAGENIAKNIPRAIIRFHYAALICSLLVSVHDRGWVFDTLNHFRYQYIIMAILGMVLIRPFAKHVIIAGVVTVCLNISQIYPFYYPRAANSPGSNLTLLLSNVFQVNNSYASVRRLIDNEHPDIVVLQELTPSWFNALEGVLNNFPFREVKALEGNFGIGVFSKHPIEEARTLVISDHGTPSIHVRIKHPAGKIAVIAIHPWPPITPRSFARRNSQLEQTAKLIQQSNEPTILAGDLNISPFSFYYKQLLKNAGLRDPRIGRGFIPTCPAFIPVIWLPCDHILSTKEISLLELRRGPYIGSDHWPMIAKFHVSERMI